MATINEARKLIYDKFISEWGVTTLIDTDNGDFTEPESDPWVRVVSRGQEGGQSSIGKKGNRRYERKGIFFVQVFTPVLTGTSQSDILAQLAMDILEGERLSGQVWTGNSVNREVGAQGKWYATNVETEFTYEEIK